MSHHNKKNTVLGRVELVDFPAESINGVPARIDTGARTNSVWASNIKVSSQSISFTLFSPESHYYTGKVIQLDSFQETVVASSIGSPQRRYKVYLSIRIRGRRINARFTLADRSRQVYPVLIGRNTLSGKFVVDVKAGKVLKEHEAKRTNELRSLLMQDKGGVK